MEKHKLHSEVHPSYNSSASGSAGDSANTEARAVAETVTQTEAVPPEESSARKLSSKNALAMVMDFSILSNSTVMLIDIIQQWRVNRSEPLLTVLLVMLPVIMFLQLPVAVMVILASHGNYNKMVQRQLHNWIIALLSLSTALMLVSDLLKVRIDSLNITVSFQAQVSE